MEVDDDVGRERERAQAAQPAPGGLSGIETDIDVERPSPARVFDYVLGGARNYAADRRHADRIAGLTPDVADTMRASRAFLRRALQLMLAEGVDQFLDLGAGIPTVGNTFDVVRQANAAGRVVHVDLDPIAVSACRRLVNGAPNGAAIQADLREPEKLLQHPDVKRLVDLQRPVGVLLIGVLHFVPDSDDPPGIVARLRDAVPPGSFFALVSMTTEGQPPEVFTAQQVSMRSGIPLIRRSREELAAQTAGLRLLEPGLVHPPLWRPDAPLAPGDRPERYGALAAVARKD